MADNWYIIRVREGSEDLAAEWFAKRLDLDTYYPVAKRFVRPRWRKSKKPIEIDSSVFRGYLFIKVPQQYDWQKFWQNPHFSEFCFGGPTASCIPDASILEIKRCEAKGEYMHFNCSDRAILALIKNQVAFVQSPLTEEKASVPARVKDVVNHIVYMEILLLGDAIQVNFPVHEIFPELFDNAY